MGPEWDGPALQFGCPLCEAAKTGQGGPPAEKRAPGWQWQVGLHGTFPHHDAHKICDAAPPPGRASLWWGVWGQ